MSRLQGLSGSFDWSRHNSTQPSEPTTSHGDKNWNRNTEIFPSGLPTPPTVPRTAMPGVVLDSKVSAFSDQKFGENRNLGRDAYDSLYQQRSAVSTTHNGSYNTVPPMNVSSTYNGRGFDDTNGNSIASYLQIPESVNKSKGSLAEFAAEITCLFWFETAETLQYAEDLPADSPLIRGLLPDAIPSIGFRKWVTTIISTTQVGKNVILLALMFIYRLKTFNPTVSGKRGSEFRLLTVALMLGNKFLDDNTYTNKTWAEVSGIPVNEIHIMEVEFLSNMRYDLYASAEKWIQWKARLGKFGAFYDRASQLPVVDENRSIPRPVTPTFQTFPHKLPSPPSTHHSLSPLPTSGSLNNHYTSLPHPLSTVPQLPNSSPLRYQPISNPSQSERKRSLDSPTDLPTAKRHHSSGPFSGLPSVARNPYSLPPNNLRVSPSLTTGNSPEYAGPSSNLDIQRLDIPRIPSMTGMASHQLAPLSVPVTRAMSSVYPISTTSYSQPVTPISAIPQTLFQNPIPHLGDPSRQLPSYPSAHTSPSNGYHTTSTTLPGLSPSYFLTHRASPYRPVRNVNTLLIPPPSGALQVPVRQIPAEQIHYQPLSKTSTERRTGLLPLMQIDSWSQSNVSTPLVHQRLY